MTEKTFHTVSWAPSAIKDAVEHASEAFKAADGPFARVSTFELSALIDATRALIEHNEREETNLKPEAPQVSMAELRERIGAVVNDYTAGEDYGSGPTRYYLTVNTPNDLTAHLAAVLFPGMELLFRAVASWQQLWDDMEEWKKAAKDAWKRETVLSWLHAEAVWHAEHHRAQADSQSLALALQRAGFRAMKDQVDAMARQIKKLQAQLDQVPEAPAHQHDRECEHVAVPDDDHPVPGGYLCGACGSKDFAGDLCPNRCPVGDPWLITEHPYVPVEVCYECGQKRDNHEKAGVVDEIHVKPEDLEDRRG